MGEGFWTLFCTSSDCSTESGNECSSGILSIINPDSCINNILIISVDILLLLILVCFFVYRISSKKIIAPPESQYTFSGSLNAVFLCSSSILEAVTDEAVSVKVVLNILYFPGSILLIFSAFQGSNFFAKGDPEMHDGAFYTPLQGAESGIEGEICSNDNVTPFEKAGLLSKMSFWWLNPLMKKGKQKILGSEDIPQLRPAYRARTWYLIFMEQLRKRKEGDSFHTPSIVSIIFYCQRRAILISGLFALIKVITLTSNPLFLLAFIKVAQGDSAFKYEAYARTLGHFIMKILESLSERQWCFKTRLIGLQVRSFISAAIYHKQLRLSNSAKLEHSPGEIVNYVAVDAYRIGEFPYWFHQIWSTSLQLCLSLLIVYYCVGLATIAASGGFRK